MEFYFHPQFGNAAIYAEYFVWFSVKDEPRNTPTTRTGKQPKWSAGFRPLQLTDQRKLWKNLDGPLDVQ
jgi:hypothetical protein